MGRWLDERRAEGIELWAAIEKPDGRVVDFLLDHGVVVYPVNPKALDRARDRFRMSGAKSDPFDARVLAAFLRSDHGHFRPLRPSSEAAQELKGLTRDYLRQVRQQTRLARFMLRIKHEQDVTMLWVEHDMQIVADLSDRIAVLHYGRKISEGTPHGVRTDPLVVEAYLRVTATT